MTRTRDIRLFAALLLPHTGAAAPDAPQRMDLDRAIDWAEALDRRLAARGYPAEPTAEAPSPPAQPTKPARADTGNPRGTGAHYDSMPAASRAQFDRLWNAYQLKQGKQEAAGAWLALAPGQALAEQLIAAAERDARGAIERGIKRHDGTRRKNLQGWLSARRWEDEAGTEPAQQRPAAQAGPSPAQQRREADLHRRGLASQIEGLERMGLIVPEALREQLAAAQAELARAKADDRPGLPG